jgi:hypothetical protein
MYSSSYCKFFRKLSPGPRGVRMSDWRLIEHKGIYCLMFSRVVGLKTHSVLYKMFFGESFDKYLSYINNFVKNYCVPSFKLV